jgi:hypothetical protein
MSVVAMPLQARRVFFSHVHKAAELVLDTMTLVMWWAGRHR